jgi:transmembrane sensor
VASKSKHSIDNFNQTLNELQIPKGVGKDIAWSLIMDKIAAQPTTHIVPLWRRVSTVAAIFTALIMMGSLLGIFLLGQVKHYSPNGNHLSVLLPDSSVVNLNADSYIKYNKVLWRVSRTVKLDGEALFTVKKGEQFSVKTGSVITQVLGTTFNVYARNNDIRVSCIEGKVAVTIRKTKQSVVLTPQQSTKSTSNKLETPTKAIASELAQWINGEFLFQNASLKTVFYELERQFNIKVNLKADPNRVYSGVFYNTNLSEALDLVCVPMGLSWHKENGTIHVYNN